MWQVVNCKNGVSSYEVHRTIGVTQKTAWFMDHRIRLALGMAPIDKLSGEVERRDDGQSALEKSFRAQVEIWKDETGHLSSITKALAHSSYLRIIGLARYSADHEIERLLLRELEAEPDHWFAALSAVTGQDPVKPEHDFDEAVAAWLEWGRKKEII